VIVVDVNILLYAVISGFPHHTKAREWWEQALNGTAEVGLAGPAIFGFLRISTNPRVLAVPLAVDQAIGYVRQWLALPNVAFLSPGPRHLDIAFTMLSELGTAANFTTDVQLAALAVEHGAELYSNDTDFGRFLGLQWINPLP
jgi:uncharacterized protein